jgi:hypothetical protein
MTLGELIDALEECNPAAEVYFDFCGLTPSRFVSWRGSYDELAIIASDDERPTVAAFLDACRDADGKTFTGYKGGEYTMARDSDVYVERHPSACTSTLLASVEDRGDVVVLHTRSER